MYIVEKQKNGRYAVKKKGASRASKTFDTYQEAILYCTKKNKELGIETTTKEGTNSTVKKRKKVVRNLKCRVRVSPNAVSIKFMKNQVSVPLSQRTRLETIIKPNTSAERPVFQSSDESIAIVNSRGVVMGVSPGTVTITATLLSRNSTASCVVTVLPDSTTSSTKPKKYYEKKKLQSIAY